MRLTLCGVAQHQLCNHGQWAQPRARQQETAKPWDNDAVRVASIFLFIFLPSLCCLPHGLFHRQAISGISWCPKLSSSDKHDLILLRVVAPFEEGTWSCARHGDTSLQSQMSSVSPSESLQWGPRSPCVVCIRHQIQYSIHTHKEQHPLLYYQPCVSEHVRGCGTVSCFCRGVPWAECLQTALDNASMTGVALNSLTSFLDVVYLCSSGCLAGPSNDSGQLVLHVASS